MRYYCFSLRIYSTRIERNSSNEWHRVTWASGDSERRIVRAHTSHDALQVMGS